MKIKSLPQIAILTGLSVFAVQNVSHAAPPTAFPAAVQREALKKLIATEPEVAALWREVQKEADAVLLETPNPTAKIVYEGRLDNDPARVDTVEHLRDMNKLALLTEAEAVSGEEKYRLKAREFIRAWTATYQPDGNPINENKLEPLLSAYGALRGGFLAPEQQKIDAWVRDLAQKEKDGATGKVGRNNNNWHPKRLKIVALAGIILSDPQFTTYASEEAKAYVARSLAADGSSEDFKSRDSLGYHNGGLKPLLRLAAILAPSGFDLYNYTAESGASAKKSVEFVVPYAEGSKTHGEFVNSKVALDKKRATAGLEHYRPGRLFDPKDALQLFEIAAAFEPRYQELVAKLAEKPASRYPTWTAVLSSVGWVQEKIEP